MASENFIQWIDADRVQVLLESFHRLTGIPSALLDRSGRIVTSRSGRELAIGWQRICTDFHRQNPVSLERCRESDTRISNQLEAGNRYSCSKCLNGLVDVAVPVVVDGEHVLTLFTGQFFFEPPDRERFRRQAADLGFDEEDYLAALDEVPVMAQETVERGMTFLAHLAELIGELAQGQLRLMEMNRRIEREVEERTRELHEANRALRAAKEEAEREAAERKRLEGESRASLAHLREVLENTTDAFFEVRADFTVTYINEKAETILGRNREELVGRNLWEAFPEAVGSHFDIEYRRALAEQTVADFETLSDRTGRWYEVHAYPTPESLSVYFRDITRRKTAEKSLLEYHRVIEQSDDLVGVVDRSSTYRLVNRAFLNQLGLEREEVIGRGVTDVLGEKVYQDIRPHLDRAFAGEPVEHEMAFDHPEGPRILLTRYDPIREESGEVALVVGLIRDITNLRKAERELEDFFNLSMDMLCVAGFDGYFKRLNPAWERTLGWTEEELLGSPWIDFVHPDDIQPESLSVYFRDITRRKTAEKSLLEYHRVIEQSDDLVGVVDRSSTYRLVNRAFLNQLGLEREEVIGRGVTDVLGEKVYQDIRPHLDRAFAGEPVEHEMAFDHPEGPRILLTRYDPIREESGEVALVVGLIRDITNLRKAERELEDFFNLSMDMLCVAGFDGYFKRLNPAWERTLGWTEEELLGSPWIDFVHPDDIQPTLDAGENLTEGREVISFENRYRCKDGTLRWLSWNSRPLPEQGLMYGVVRDVTAAKEVEAALRDRDRLQGALETAGAVCHELNQPLQAITGFTDLLLLEVTDQEGPSEKARKIQEAVRLISSITRKLSGITRYQTMDYFQGRIIDIDRSSDPAPGNATP